MKRKTLSERYADLDYPDNSEDELKHVTDIFSQISKKNRGSMDAFAAMLEEFEPQPPSWALHLVQGMQAIAFKLGCSENSLYKTPPDATRDSPDTMKDKQAAMKANTGLRQLTTWLKGHAESVNGVMRTALEKNTAMSDFYELLCTSQEMRIEEQPRPVNAWSVDGQATHVVMLFKKGSAEDGTAVSVSGEQARILAVCHQVNHLIGYMLTALMECKPAGKAHTFTELWSQLAMVHCNEPNLLSWEEKACTAFELHLLGMYAALEVSVRWLK